MINDHVFEDEDDVCWFLTLPCKKRSFLGQIPYYGDDREMKGMTAEKL